MRTAKEADERKHEIMDAAESLFVSKGYDRTTISDILGVTGIARGTLYYHYKSKEEVLDGIIARRGAANAMAARAIAEDTTLSALEKLFQIMLAQKPGNDQEERLVTSLENAGNAQLFQKSLTEILLCLAPVVGRVIEQGNQEGVFHAPCAQECAEILLAASHALFDNRAFRRTPEESGRKILAFLSVAEQMLGATGGSLLQMTQLL